MQLGLLSHPGWLAEGCDELAGAGHELRGISDPLPGVVTVPTRCHGLKLNTGRWRLAASALQLAAGGEAIHALVDQFYGERARRLRRAGYAATRSVGASSLTLLRSATTRPPTIWLSTTNCSSYPAAITLAAVVRAARITPDLTRVATFATGRAVRTQAQRVIPSIHTHADAAIRSPASHTGTSASPSFSSSSAAPCASQIDY